MPGPDRGRLKDAFFSLVMRWVMPLIQYRTPYAARVVSQDSDGRLDVVPDDPRMPGLQHVPIRGLPGVKVSVVSGARVWVEFENGDRTKPVATLFEPTSLASLTIEASAAVIVRAPSITLGAGGPPLARVGDPVQVLVTGPSGPAYGSIVGGSGVSSSG